MPDVTSKVKTVILVMFENRSFDHMLGHLSYEKINSNVEGLIDPMPEEHKCLYQGDIYRPFKIPNDSKLVFDLPHEFNYVSTQLALSDVTNEFTMQGFVEAYAAATKVLPNPQNCDPMGFFSSDQVPITNFLAKTFCTCDHWFAPLPTSTQPNRTMAFCGDSSIHNTALQLIHIQDSIFHWMERNNIRWNVYHDGLSFFVLYPELWDYVLGHKFKDYESFYYEMKQDPSPSDPQVIIIEPSYQDAPHIGSDLPNDNHAPLGIGWGEEFLRRTYEAVIANPKKWEQTVMIVYYDEHGGFFDHVPPPFIKYTTSGKSPFVFKSLGPRIPGIIVSPFVPSGHVCHSLFDHTSVLQFLAEIFTPGKPYSETVEQRRTQELSIKSISEALINEKSWTLPNVPSQAISVKSALGDTIQTAPATTMGQSFEAAANQMMEERKEDVGKKYPELFQWRDAVQKSRAIN